MEQMKITAPPGRQEVIITRTINAPKEVVFKTVTDPLLIPEWWGPRRLTTFVHKMVVTPAETWRIVQQDDAGKEYGFHGVYHEVVSSDRLVYTSEFEGFPGHVSLNIDEFTEQDGQTIIKTRLVFQSVEDRDQMLQWRMEEGMRETTDRLNDL